MILAAIASWKEQDCGIMLFSKILENKVDEGFWWVQDTVHKSIVELYKSYLREKYPKLLAGELT